MIALVVWVSGGRLEPREYDLKEYWSWKGPGQPPWFVRAIKNGGCFWKDWGDTSKRGLNLSEENDSSFNHSRLGSSDNKDGTEIASASQRVLTPP